MKLNRKRTMLVGLAFLSICAFWQFYDNEIPKILKNTFGMGETLTGFIMALDNILALFLLPFFGALSDKVHTKIGKRMPFILCGTALAAVLLVILAGLASKPALLIPFIIVLLLLLVAMGTYRSPAVSLMPELTPAPLRSKANAIINLMGTIGGVYTLLMIKFFVHTPSDGSLTNYMPMALSIVAIMVVSVGILYFTVPENKCMKEVEQEDMTDQEEAEAKASAGKKMPPEVKRSMIFLLLSVFFWFTAYNAVTTAFSRYVEQVWNLHNGEYADCLMVGTVAAVIAYLPIGSLSQKIGRKKMIFFGIVLMAVSYALAIFAVQYAFWVNILFAFVGIGWASINVNSYPMVVEMSRAGDIGKFTGLYYTFSMAAQVFTPIVSGFLLEHVSYMTLFPYSAFFMVVAGCTMLMVKHGDIDPKKAVQ
ncbi:MAG: MFS transporter [Solobacterium sp.]|jgi:Na+/melibiose symporter-like transporter|nr:MFS transporter [Solobacterium sp.]MCH4205726.1 MFS transporter [Solobacterium sp.]MCH4227250.1 MFS transporter [Solobacterium sp.]MCH4282556.1 MFS transporter [Solobacterium sp.]